VFYGKFKLNSVVELKVEGAKEVYIVSPSAQTFMFRKNHILFDNTAISGNYSVYADTLENLVGYFTIDEPQDAVRGVINPVYHVLPATVVSARVLMILLLTSVLKSVFNV